MNWQARIAKLFLHKMSKTFHIWKWVSFAISTFVIVEETPSGQTPFTMTTKITKTASPKKTILNPEKNKKNIQKNNFIKEILCNFLVRTLHFYVAKVCNFFFSVHACVHT